MKPTIEVVAGILWRGEEYLAVERPEGFNMAGWWEFPGGKVEPDESPEAALVRELEEELAVSVRELKFWRDKTHEYEKYFVHLQFYHVTSFDGEPQSVEGQRMCWVRPENALEAVRFLPADVEIAEDLVKLAVPL